MLSRHPQCHMDEFHNTRKTPPPTRFPVGWLGPIDDNPQTGVEKVDGERELVNVRYYNMMGVESASPFEGVNIVVREYSDGSRIATKVLRK